MDLTKNEKLVLNSKTCHPSGLHHMRRNPHPKKEDHGDCGVRAIVLATGMDYSRVKFYADRWNPVGVTEPDTKLLMVA